MNTDTSKPIGFRPTQPIVPGGTIVGWRIWAGPLLVFKGSDGRIGITRTNR